jgi:hypothetical protein
MVKPEHIGQVPSRSRAAQVSGAAGRGYCSLCVLNGQVHRTVGVAISAGTPAQILES